MALITDETFTTTFDQLLPPKDNPRKTIGDVSGLAASIRSTGQIQNLVVKREGKRFRVVAGGRRFAAIKMLIEAEEVPKDFAIKVAIGKGKPKELEQAALVENIQRQDMEPLDEAEGFVRLIDDGWSLDDIAEKTGISTMTVRRRLALAALCNEAKEAVRSGDVSLSEAQALTMGTHDEQREMLQHVGSWSFDADNIKEAFTDKKPSLAAAIFDPALYTGTVTRDLFAADDAVFFDDRAQFMELQRAALNAKAEAFREQGKTVIDLTDDPNYSWHDYYEHEEGDTVLIRMSVTGRVEIRENVLRRPSYSSTLAASSASGSEPTEKPVHSGALLELIGAIRSAAVMQAVIANRRKALEIAVYQIMSNFQGFAHGIDQHWSFRTLRAKDAGIAILEALDAVAERAAAPLRAAGMKDAEYEARPVEAIMHAGGGFRRQRFDLYGAISGLSDDDLEALHSLLVAVSFGQYTQGMDTSGDEFNRVAQDLDVDVRRSWRPSEAFLKSYRTDRLKEIAVECGYAADLSAVEKAKKGELVKALVAWFAQAAEADAPSDMQAIANAWTDPALLFPAVAPGGEPSASCPSEEVDDPELVSEAA